MIQQVSSNLKKHIEPILVDKLLEHYAVIKRNYRLMKHETAELNGSKFSEVVFRILENKTSKDAKYTPLDHEIKKFADRCRSFEQLPKADAVDDTLRIHIPRTLILLVDVRNKRAIGHISGIHSPNLLDSTLIVHCADWILAELIRLYHGCSTDEAQSIVDQIIQIDIPLVADVGSTKRVLRLDLKFPDQVLALLLNESPKKVSDRVLYDWTEHSNFTVFKRDVLNRLHKARKIEYSKNKCQILPPGIHDIENKIKK